MIVSHSKLRTPAQIRRRRPEIRRLPLVEARRGEQDLTVVDVEPYVGLSGLRRPSSLTMRSLGAATPERRIRLE